MAKLSILAGATSQSVNVFIQDSSSTVGAGLSGLVYNTGSLAAYYTFAGANATATAITLATLATVTTAWSSGGFIEIDATHMKGLYRLDLPNAVLAASKGRSVVVYLYGATNMAPCVLEIELTGWDNQSTTDGGLSKLTSLTFTVSNKIDANVYTWNGTAVSSPATAGIPEVNVKNIANTAQTARDIGASVLLSSGTGTGQLDFTSGVVKANLAQILGTALTETAGQIAAAFKQFFNIASPTSTMNEITLVDTITTYTGNTKQTGDSYVRLGAPAGASVSADIAEIEGETDTLLAGVIVTTNNDKTGYALTSGERNSIADALLDRDMSTGTDSGSTTVRTARQALRFLRNKWTLVSTTLTVYKEDDATSSWTGVVGTTPGADPISSNDPAGP